MAEIILCKYCQNRPVKKYSKYSNGEFCSKECAHGYSTREKRKIINSSVSIKSGGSGKLELPPEPIPPKERRVDSLRNVLFNKIHNDFYYGDKNYYYEWALIEGLNRLRSIDMFYKWEFIDSARKEHSCIRGCKINEGQLYFKYNYGYGYSDYDKICQDCFALILYHRNDLESISPYLFTHYDLEKNEPCKIDPEYEKKELELFRDRHSKWQEEVDKIKKEFLKNQRIA